MFLSFKAFKHFCKLLEAIFEISWVQLSGIKVATTHHYHIPWFNLCLRPLRTNWQRRWSWTPHLFFDIFWFQEHPAEKKTQNHLKSKGAVQYCQNTVHQEETQSLNGKKQPAKSSWKLLQNLCCFFSIMIHKCNSYSFWCRKRFLNEAPHIFTFHQCRLKTTEFPQKQLLNSIWEKNEPAILNSDQP